MGKILLILLIFFAEIPGCLSQRRAARTSPVSITTTSATANPVSATLTQEDFKQVINQQFGYVLTGQSKNVIGNFASLDLAATQVDFGGSILSKKGSITGVKLSGGVTDSFSEIFSNSKLNSNVSIELQHHFFSNDKKEISYLTQSGIDFNSKIQAINDKSEKIKQGIIGGKPRNDLLIKQAGLVKDTAKKIVVRDSLIRIAKRSKLPADSARASNASIELRALRTQIDSVTNAIRILNPTFVLLEIENNRRAVELSALQKLPPITVVGFDLNWWSMSYKVSKNSFTLFDATATFENQKADREFVTHEIRVQRSRYKWSNETNKSFYLTGGVGVSLTDNFSTGLTKLELTEVTQYGSTANQRSSTKKSNVYTGDYKSDLVGVRIFADYYRFLFNGNAGAVHIYPEFKYLQDARPTYNLGLGLLFPFRSSKDDTSIINAELYYNFLDVFNDSDVESNVFQRNTVGVRFSLPINFKP